MNAIVNEVLINDIGYNLDELERDCWVRLQNGALKSKDPFHTPSVATFDSEGVQIRTVVLRKVIPTEKQLSFHTDTRSRKWTQLQTNPTVSALFYSPAARIQIRINGIASLQFNNPTTAEAWQNTTLSSRRCYLVQPAPSSYTDFPTSGMSEKVEQEKFSLEESEIGYQNFGIVSIHVESIDWLFLHHAGHRRAFFDYKHGTKRWMVP